MPLSCSEYLHAIEPYIPPQLVSATILDRIRQIARLLPGSSNFGFESQLNNNEPCADFLVAIIPSDGSRDRWVAPSSPLASRAALREHPTWATIHRFMTGWCNAAPWSGLLRDAWVEFDMHDEWTDVPVPSFFFGFDGQTFGHEPGTPEAILEVLREQSLQGCMRDVFRTCFKEVPSGASLFQVGLMLARKVDALRLCVTDLAMEGQLPGYLERIGWPGDVSEVQEIVAGLLPFTRKAALDIDITDSVLPKIGIECYVKERHTTERFLDYLVEHQLCTPERRVAIVDWLGYTSNETDPEKWPQDLARAAAELGSDMMSTIMRTLNHVKIVYEPDRGLLAKAYLGVRHFWIRKTRTA